MMPGRFLTVEGIEGVGKSTQVERLAQRLRDSGIPHRVTREPGGTPLDEKIRALVLTAGDEAIPPAAELLMMFAARSVHLSNLIEPALHAGQWVLCDRFTDATYAYQGAGRGVATETIATLETLVQGTRRPDLTLLLDAPVELALARVRTRRPEPAPGAAPDIDRFEREREEFFVRVRNGYLARAAAYPKRFVVIDATAAPEEVTAAILAELEGRAWIS